jgi:hypothetical protein
VTGQRKQLNKVTLQDDLKNKTLSIAVEESDLEYFKKIDEEIIEQAKKSKMDWFGKELSDETIVGAYQESVTDGIVGVSLATVKGECVTRAFDRQKNDVKVDDVKKDTVCDIILELSGLWFLKKSFGPIWRVLQVRIRDGAKQPEFSKECLFEDEPEDEDDPADYLD